MVTGGSIAEELFHAIRLRDYCEYVSKLNRADIMTPIEFKYSEYSSIYELDTRICYNDRRINKNHVYDIFGDFSSTDGKSVKLGMLDEIGDNYDWYENRGRVVLNMQSRDLTQWLKYHLNNQSARADEIAIYALSHIYDRHTVILGNGRPWCTIRATGDPKEADFVNSCQVHLLYIGKDMYAPLTPRMDIPDYLREQDDHGIWERHPPIDYTAFFKESEYTDYCEITGSKTGYPSRQHRHDEPTHTVSIAPLDPSMGQPVFPSPIPQLMPVNQIDSVNQEAVKPNELVTTGCVEDQSDADKITTPPAVPPQLPLLVDIPTLTPPRPSAVKLMLECELSPPVPPVIKSTSKDADLRDLRESTTSDNSDDKTKSDSSARYLKVDKELSVIVHRLPDSVLHKYISTVTISEDTEDKNTVGMRLRNRPNTKQQEARHPRHVKRIESYASMLASDTDNTDSDVKPKRHVKPRPSLEPSSSRQRSQRIIEKNRIKSTGSDMISGNSYPENANVTDAYNADTEGEGDVQNEPVKPKRGKFTVNHHGLKKAKRVRHFKCKLCDEVFTNTKDCNTHYADNHPMIPCETCGRYFRNPSSLHRHRYVHTKTENIFPCTKCERVFPFESQLASHMFKHRKVSHFPCTADGCKKSFKQESDRRAHELSHTGPLLKCGDCDYSTRDKRYLKQHSRVHSGRFVCSCPKCGQGFRFYEQKTRHIAKPCKKDKETSNSF